MSCSKWVLSVVLLGLIATNAIPVNGISCGDAVSALIPCGSFLLGYGESTPSPKCCASAKSLEKLASGTASRRAVCECFKESGPSYGVKTERAKELPSLCHLNIRIAITPDVNCNNIK